MAIVDTSRRLPTRSILQDIEAYEGLAAVREYTARRPEASAEVLQANLKAMQAKQQKETEMLALAKAATDEARQAEWEFHNGVMAMKANVRGTFAFMATKPSRSATRKNLIASVPVAAQRLNDWHSR